MIHKKQPDFTGDEFGGPLSRKILQGLGNLGIMSAIPSVAEIIWLTVLETPN